MTATQGVTELPPLSSSFLNSVDKEPESINFHESLRFFQQQLNLNGSSFTSSPTNTHISSNDSTPKFTSPIPKLEYDDDENAAFEDKNAGFEPKTNGHISVPTVDSILESVRVLRAIQKSQEQSKETTWTLSKVLSTVEQTHSLEQIERTLLKVASETNSECILNPVLDKVYNHQESVSEMSSNNETVPFWPSNLPKKNSNDMCNKNGESNENQNVVFWPSNIITNANKDQNNSNNLCSKSAESSEKNEIPFWPSNFVKDTNVNKEISINSCNIKGKSIDSQNVPFWPPNVITEENANKEYSNDSCNENEKHNYNQNLENIREIINSAKRSNGSSSILEVKSTEINNVSQHIEKTVTSETLNLSKIKESESFVMDKDQQSDINEKESKSATDSKVLLVATNSTSSRVESAMDSGSSYYVSSECSSCASPNHAIDSSSGYSSSAYTCHSLKDESKIPSLLTEWTTEWLETRINESDTHETPSLCSSEFNIHQEISTPEKLIENTSTFVEDLTPEKSIKNNATTNSEGASTVETVKDDVSTVINNSAVVKSISENNIRTEVEITEDSTDEKNTEKDAVTIIEKKSLEKPIENNVSTITKDFSSEKSIRVDTLPCDENAICIKKSIEENAFPAVGDPALKEKVKSNCLKTIKNSKFENGETDSNISKENTTTTNSELESSMRNFSESRETNQTLSKSLTAVEPSEALNQTEYEIKSNKPFELIEHDEKLNNFEECTEVAKQILAAKRSNVSLKAKVYENSETISNLSSNQNGKNISGHSLARCDSRAELDSESSNTFVNKVELDLNSQQSPKNKKSIDDLKTKKFITSSWDLVSIVKILYRITEPQAPKVCQPEHALQVRAYILSKGAFYKKSEGYYDILIQNQTFSVLEEEDIVFSFSLNHAEMYLENGNTLILDNKMGRCLHLKCETLEELPLLKNELETHCDQCWATECINLVHYPLKCHQNIVIIDLGSCSTRAGVLMDEATLPTLFFPSVCATNKSSGKHLYGVDALQTDARKNSTVSFPLRPSEKIIKHTVDIGQVSGIFKKIFSDLKIETSKYTVLVCLPRSLSTNVQNNMVKVLLEDLKVKAVSLAHQAILTMYAHNVSTGIVVDIGDRLDILPVIDGFIVESGVTRLPYGGQRLIHHMKHALAQKHISLSNDIDSFVVQYITENLAYIAEDYETENEMASLYPQMVRKSVDLQNFALDVNCLQSAVLDEARFKVPEGLFDPERWGLDCPGVHKLVQKAITAASVDARKKVAENIYLSGGVSMIPGFVQRLRREVTKLNQPRIMPKVYASHYRYHCTYIGACKFARMDVFPQVCVTKEEFTKNQTSCLKKFMLCV